MCKAIINANTRAFNLYVEPLKLHGLYFIYTCMYILFLSESGNAAGGQMVRTCPRWPLGCQVNQGSPSELGWETLPLVFFF